MLQLGWKKARYCITSIRESKHEHSWDMPLAAHINIPEIAGSSKSKHLSAGVLNLGSTDGLPGTHKLSEKLISI